MKSRGKRQLTLGSSFAIPEEIIFHADFDGVSSAALLARFWNVRQEVDLRPVNYSIKRTWLEKDVRKSAVVDFHYHPLALWWFDHHETTFLKNKLRKKFKPDSQHQWDPTYPSCPPLILDTISKYHDGDARKLREEFKEWTEWSNIIDSADYESPEQAVRGKGPGILINQALSQTYAFDLRKYLVRRIAAGDSPSEVAHDNKIKKLWKEFRRKQENTLEKIENRLKIYGNVGVCDLTDNPYPYVKYGTYIYAPDVSYSITLYNASYNGGKSYNISLSANPWKSDQQHNLGKLAEKYGGGGHKKVGSVPCGRNKGNCLKICNEIIETLSKCNVGSKEKV